MENFVFSLRATESSVLLPLFNPRALTYILGVLLFPGVSPLSPRLDLAEGPFAVDNSVVAIPLLLSSLTGSRPQARSLSSCPHLVRMFSVSSKPKCFLNYLFSFPGRFLPPFPFPKLIQFPSHLPVTDWIPSYFLKSFSLKTFEDGQRPAPSVGSFFHKKPPHLTSKY